MSFAAPGQGEVHLENQHIFIDLVLNDQLPHYLSTTTFGWDLFWRYCSSHFCYQRTWLGPVNLDCVPFGCYFPSVVESSTYIPGTEYTEQYTNWIKCPEFGPQFCCLLSVLFWASYSPSLGFMLLDDNSFYNLWFRSCLRFINFSGTRLCQDF